MSDREDAAPELVHLGYEQGAHGAGYYTGRVRKDAGVCVAKMIGTFFIQFFPWGGDDDRWETGQATYEAPLNGHTRYSRWITGNARMTTPALSGPRQRGGKYPYFECSGDADLLTIKCLIEEGLTQLERLDVVYQANDADPATGKAVE